MGQASCRLIRGTHISRTRTQAQAGQELLHCQGHACYITPLPSHHRPAAKPRVAAHTRPRLLRWGRAWSRRCAGSRSAAPPAGLRGAQEEQRAQCANGMLWSQGGGQGRVPHLQEHRLQVGALEGAHAHSALHLSQTAVSAVLPSRTTSCRPPPSLPCHHRLPGGSGSGAQSSGWKRSSSWHTRCRGRPGTTSRRMDASVSTCRSEGGGQVATDVQHCKVCKVSTREGSQEGQHVCGPLRCTIKGAATTTSAWTIDGHQQCLAPPPNYPPPWAS